MKKIFTLIGMALVAMSVNAQEVLPEHVYPIKSITWGDITWKNGNNKKDKDNNDMLFLMGSGNGYKNVYAEEIYTDGEPTGKYRAYYTYIDYDGGETGLPGYGLYYKFTPSKAGVLKVNVWVNKGRRKTFVLKGSAGVPLTYGTDFEFDGYINGENVEGVPVYFSTADFKAYRATAAETDAAITKYVITPGDKAIWGWITLNVEANETYLFYQQSSQLGFGGFEFDGQSYSSIKTDRSLADEFAAVVDADGKANNVSERGSVVTFTAAGVAVEAVGVATPTAVEPDLGPSGISSVKASSLNANAPMYNLAGQKVSNDFKGMVIQNGRKFVIK